MNTRKPKTLARWCASIGFLFFSSLAQAAPLVDVLVLYIDAAQQTTSGRDMDARIGSYIEYSNQALKNSNVDMRLRLVGVERVDVNYTYVTSTNLNELRSNRDVALLRQKYGADLVTLINLRQPMSGGYVCGIGYIPGGEPSTGRLASNASTAAFSLVGVDCGLSTFLHELGHNMSLGHSHIQNENGGVWPWARGHGVEGMFSTIMAYPQSYGTRNQLQRLSNPEQATCMDFPCGVHRDHSHGADAARSLNSLAQQVAAFMPTVVEVDQPAPGLCVKDESRGNLIRNGEFDALEGWTTLFNVSRLSQTQLNTTCVDNLLAVNNRSQPYSDAYQDLSDRIVVRRNYHFSAKFGVAGTERDTVQLAFRIREGSQVRYQYLEPVSATSQALTAYQQEFVLDATTQPDEVGLVIYGPQANVDILADELVLVDIGSIVPVQESRIILHERFEREAQGWSSYGSSRTSFSSRAFEGSYSLRNHSRTYSYSGLMREMTGLIDSGVSYEIGTSLYIQDSGTSTGNAGVWIYYVDDRGGNWQRVIDNNIAINRWQAVSGAFMLNPVGNLTQVRLLVAGPRRVAEIYVDDLKVTRQ